MTLYRPHIFMREWFGRYRKRYSPYGLVASFCFSDVRLP